jgi:hypothetical protein
MPGTPNLKHTWKTIVTNGYGSSLIADPPLDLAGDAETNFGVVVAPGQTAEIDAPVIVANIVSAFIKSNQAVEVFTNAADGSGGQHISVPAGRSVSWNNQMGIANPFTPNITKFYVTNNGTAPATVYAGFLLQE